MDVYKPKSWILYCFLAAAVSATHVTLKVRWCVTSEKEQAKCDSLRTFIGQGGIAELRCIPTASRYECWRYIRDGKADLIKVDDTEIYTAGKLYDLIPVAKESFSTDKNADTFLYKAVAVVKKDGPIQDLNGLRNKKSCHTGVMKTTGWVVPVSSLLKKGIMTQADCDNTVKSVATFFSQSCAPGAFKDINNPGKNNPQNICEICRDKKCPSDDEFAGYGGAFKCLNEGMGEVAFVKHSTIDDAVAKGETVDKEAFRLLCPDGTLKHVNEWKLCNWATRPTDAIVTSKTKDDHDISHLRTFLESLNASAPVKFFQSSDFGEKNLMFTDGVKQLIGVGDTQRSYRTYLDSGYITTMEHFTKCNMQFRWCIKSAEEMNKCKDMKSAMMSKRITNELECVMGKSSKDCINKIQKGKADITTLSGTDVYTGGRYNGIIPIVSESYAPGINEDDTSYWPVAVVKKSNRGVNFKNLKGTKSCHTGIMKTSGWIVPIGLLLDEKIMTKTDKCNMAKNAGDFFKESCVPGALDPKYNPDGDNPANLCSLCGGKDNCQRDNSNIYYGYKGAFRCLVEKNADVAFIKHTTVSDVINSNTHEPWSQNLQMSDFELLCEDGSRKPLTDWATCYLARAPSRVVVTSKSKSKTEIMHFQRVLSQTEYYFGNGSTIFNLFRSPSGFEDTIFSDKTTKLNDIPEFKQTYKTWLDAEYLKAQKAIDTHVCTSGATEQIASFIILCLTFASLPFFPL